LENSLFNNNQSSDLFNKEKFLIIKNFFNYQEVLFISKIKDQIYKNNFKRIENTRFVVNSFNDEILQLANNKKIVDLVKILLMNQNLSLYMGRILIKDEKSNANITPHQDVAYFHGTPNKLNIFIFITGNSLENGGLSFAPNTSKYGLMPQGNIPVENFKYNYLCPNLNSNDVIISDFYTWHWSNKITNSGHKRVIIQLTFQSSECGSYCDLYSKNKPILISGVWKTRNFFSLKESQASNKDNTPKININQSFNVDEIKYTINYT
jgi:hypothetical protein